MVKKTYLLGVMALLVGAAAVIDLGACSVSCEDNLTCAPDGAQEASGESGADAPSNCDLSKDPKDSQSCVDDSVGVFVDATSGKDSNPGTKTAPVQTIAAALNKTAILKRLYVCEGTYPEDLTLDVSHDGVSIYGGWKCLEWSYSAGKPVIGKTQNSAKLDSLTKPVAIEDVEIDSKDGDSTNVSSVAMLVNASANVVLTRVKLVAGKGQSGVAGTLSAYSYPTQPQLNGNNADGGAGGALTTVTCPGAQSTTGGKGGDNGFDGNAGQPSADGGAAGTVVNCINLTQGGGKGANGSDALAASKIAALGTLSASGWSSAFGAKGSDGSVGQGGGGGAGTGGGGGGGGGCGGCPGAGGSGGTGGGASVALAVVASTVTVNTSALVASTPGDGGIGVAGQPGQTLFGFHGNGVGAGCQGGNGGLGGSGGGGAGGAGGISVGVLWSGSSGPNIDTPTQSTITVPSKGGAKGVGGAPGVNDGIDGVAQPVLQTP